MAADVVSWVFANKTYNRNRPVLIDAANAKVSVSAHQAHLYVRWLIAGLKAAGLQQGDGVCILSFNHVCRLPGSIEPELMLHRSTILSSSSPSLEQEAMSSTVAQARPTRSSSDYLNPLDQSSFFRDMDWLPKLLLLVLPSTTQLRYISTIMISSQCLRDVLYGPLCSGMGKRIGYV